MKLKSTFLFALAAIATLASCDKNENIATPAPVAVEKTVMFEIFSTKDYSTSYHADQEATVVLSIRRTDKATMKETVVFDSTFTKLLKDIPLEANQIVIVKKMPVVAQNEWVNIGSGSRVGAFSYGSYEYFPEEQLEKKVEIVF